MTIGKVSDGVRKFKSMTREGKLANAFNLGRGTKTGKLNFLGIEDEVMIRCKVFTFLIKNS